MIRVFLSGLVATALLSFGAPAVAQSPAASPDGAVSNPNGATSPAADRRHVPFQTAKRPDKAGDAGRYATRSHVPHQGQKPGKIQDGTSNTMMLGESLDQRTAGGRRSMDRQLLLLDYNNSQIPKDGNPEAAATHSR